MIKSCVGVLLNDAAILSIAYDNVIIYRNKPGSSGTCVPFWVNSPPVLGPVVGPLAAFGLFYACTMDRILQRRAPATPDHDDIFLLSVAYGHLTIFQNTHARSLSGP